MRTRGSPENSESGPGTEEPEGFRRARLVRSGYGWRAFFREYRWQGLALLLFLGLLASGAAIVVLANTNGSTRSPAPSVQGYGTALGAVPTNRVTGSGTATVQLRGDTATITMDTNGLLGGAPHLAHIHGEGEGKCPTASSAHLHNGHLAISTGDAIRLYGGTLVSFTQWGSTSGSVPNNIDMNRYPASANIRYKRTMTIPRLAADLVRDGDGVIVVHGIDYNANHVYDFGALGVSDLDKTLPGEATAPALCGSLRLSPATQSATAQSQAGVRTATYVASLAPEPALYAASPAPGTASSSWQAAAKPFALLCHLAVPRSSPSGLASAGDAAAGGAT